MLMFGMSSGVLGCTQYSWVSWDPYGLVLLHVVDSSEELLDLIEIFILARVDSGGDGDRDGGESGGEASEVAEQFEVAHGVTVLAVEGIDLGVDVDDAFGFGGFDGVGESGVLAGDFAIKGDLMSGPGAEFMPVGDDHLLDDVVFGFGDGLEGVDVALEEGDEVGAGFAGEEDGFGELVVFEVAGGGVCTFLASGGGGGAF